MNPTTTIRTRTATRSSATAAAPSPGAGSAVLILRLARLSGHRLGQALAAVGMRGPEFAVLHHLEEAGPLSQQQIGRALRVHPSNLVALLDQLEDAGLILRERDPADRRRHVVELSRAGQRQLIRAQAAAAEAERELLAPLTPAERKRFRTQLERLTANACGGGFSC